MTKFKAIYFWEIFSNFPEWPKMPRNAKKFFGYFLKNAKKRQKSDFLGRNFFRNRNLWEYYKRWLKKSDNKWSRNTSRFLKQSSKLSQLEDSGLRPRKIETGIGQLYQNLKTRLGHYIRFWAFFWKMLVLVCTFRNGMNFQVSSIFLLCVWGKNT